MSWTYHKGVQDSGSSFLHIAALKWNIISPWWSHQVNPVLSHHNSSFHNIFYWMCLKMNGTPAPPIFCMFVTGKNDDKPWEIYGNIRHAAMGPWDLAQIPGLQKILRFVSPLLSPFALLCPRRATMALHRPCPAFGSWRIFNFGRWERDCNKDDPQDLPLTRYRNIVIIMCLFDTEIASSY